MQSFRLSPMVCVFLLCATPLFADRPNVLLICVDDLRPELNCFGKNYIQSPNIDALAAGGRAFHQHYVQSPTCGASRYALLTGMYGSSSNGAIFDRAKKLAADSSSVPPSLPAWFRQHGYRTVSVGKVSHHPGGRGGPDWDDEAIPEMPNSWDRHLMPVGPWQHPRGSMHGLANGEIRKNVKDMDVFQSVAGNDSTYPDGLTVEESLHQLDQLTADGEPPFFLAVGIIRPHLPFGAPAKYMEPYRDATLPPIPHPRKPDGKTTWHSSGEFMKYNRWGRNPNDDDAFATEVRKHYAACVTYADAQVGRVLKRLDETGESENTIVVLWGDHGWNLGEHAIWGKHCLFEESLRSPLIIRYPGIKSAGKKSNALVETIDVFPTLCDLANVPKPDFLHGTSLKPMLNDPAAKGFSAIGYQSKTQTIRTPTHRLIRHQTGEVELYDHRTKDAETKNIAASEADYVDYLSAMIDARLKTPLEKKQRPQLPFRWVNPLPPNHADQLVHATFPSKIAGEDVGYSILLPKDYDSSAKRYPVVYYLHGGRPGSESKSVTLADKIVELREQHHLDPVIYVFVNGGPVSHYNVPDRIGIPGKPDARGADVFIQELIPHIDSTYRTIASRTHRGLEGFSQGGRGTMRLSLRYPELFSSVAAGGGGYETEKKISESPDSAESESLRFARGDNTWDLAKAYVAKTDAPAINLMIYVGTKGFNYENNLAYMEYLKLLGIEHRALIVPDVTHSATGIYEKQGLEIMRFHQANFSRR
ncbi:MAG: sulfatase-like hydrolase/transferase [Planctomycetales bacterium]|nr:sulfatase-like hydrolase/transferase [Planctomycetales bacterium]